MAPQNQWKAGRDVQPCRQGVYKLVAIITVSSFEELGSMCVLRISCMELDMSPTYNCTDTCVCDLSLLILQLKGS